MTTVFIAGNLSATDWHAARDAAQNANDPTEWRKIFDRFFLQRLALRYLSPIETLQSNGTRMGEGFTIASIQCALIEFLASTRCGKNYRYGQKDDALHYSRSGKIFTDFLSSQKPFSAFFDAATAKSFYEDVRCGLLHEACTKGGWTIWAESSSKSATAIDPAEKVLFRDDMQKVILQYIAHYREEVSSDAHLRQAFLRKMDHLFQP